MPCAYCTSPHHTTVDCHLKPRPSIDGDQPYSPWI